MTPPRADVAGNGKAVVDGETTDAIDRLRGNICSPRSRWCVEAIVADMRAVPAGGRVEGFVQVITRSLRTLGHLLNLPFRWHS